MNFSLNSPFSAEIYGPLSPLRVETSDDVPIVLSFTFSSDVSVRILYNLLVKGIVPTHLPTKVKNDLVRLDRYLDIPLLSAVTENEWQTGEEWFLWFYKLRGYKNYEGPSTEELAEHGYLETLKWVVDNDRAARSGHLETLNCIKTNGGEWTSSAANRVARSGHLETLNWIGSNGGE